MLTVLLLGAATTGAYFVGQATASQAGKPDLLQVATNQDEVNPKPAPGRMFVLGRVLDPTGKPVPNASVMASARSKAIGASIGLAVLSSEPIGHASSDGSGRFRVDAPRTSSSRYDRFSVLAVAPGYGIGWVDLDPDINEPTAEITLQPEQVILHRGTNCAPSHESRDRRGWPLSRQSHAGR